MSISAPSSSNSLGRSRRDGRNGALAALLVLTAAVSLLAGFFSFLGLAYLFVEFLAP